MTRAAPIWGAVALAFGWTFGATRPDPTDLTFLAVGQGDCAVLRDGGRTVLIDAGPKTAYADAGARIVVPRLRAMGVTGVDLILLSHPDLDHVGGVPAILAAFPDARLAMSTAFRSDSSMTAHLKEWGMAEASVLWLPAAANVEFGHSRLRIACPPFNPGGKDNDGSMFVHVAEAGATAVFSGDASAEVERLEETNGDWRAQLLHVGHHGSRTSSDPSWIGAVRPETAVVSVGRGNVYGHPHPETLERLKDASVPVLRTDRDGDLRFVSQNGRFVRVSGGG